MTDVDAAKIDIRLLKAFDEMRVMVDLQKTYWGTSLESVIPAHMLFSIASYGGHVLAAFDGEKPVGMLVGFLGTHGEESERPAMANLQFVSKRMVVLPEYRSHGLGFRLKLQQRQLSIQQGVRLVVWTFDPLMALNAHLNIRKLGAVCRQYLKDYYGTSSEGGLVTLGSSDRFMVEWWVTNRRVEERLYGSRQNITLPQYLEAETPIVNLSSFADDMPTPAVRLEMPSGTLALVEIPVDYSAMVARAPELAKQWRAHSREVFTELIRRGYIVTDFVRANYQAHDRAFYLMSYDGPQFDSFSVN